jgi:arylsulfatase A-like enzyme
MFRNAYCTSPLCAPSRAAIVTGQPPHQNGMNGLPGPFLGDWDLGVKERHLAAVFSRSGFKSVLAGFEHESQDCLSLGFQDVIHGSGSSHNGGESLVGIGSNIGAWLDQRGPEPFYMQIGCFETHRDWATFASPFDSRGVWKAPYLIDDPEIDEEMALMQGASAALDSGIGEILDAFESRGIDENTVFVFTTDHGLDFPRAKGTMFDPGIEVFLFIRYAGIGGGRVIDDLVSHTDIYPTLLELCGISVPDETDGLSLLSLLRTDPDRERRDTVYFEKTYHDNYDPIRGLRTQKYKYVMNFDAQTLYDVRIATAPRYNWFRTSIKKYTQDELYDLGRDPDEVTNLADRPDAQDVRNDLRKRLARWMAETNDPLLDGPVPSPYHLRMSAMMKELAKDVTE